MTYSNSTSYSSVYVNEYREAQLPSMKYQVVSQDKFLAELDPRSHDINNPIIYPDKYIKNKEGEIEGISYIARVSVALQDMIATKQAVHLFAKPPKFTSLRNGDEKLFTNFKEYWTQRNASCALYLMAKSALTTGDGAIYFRMADKKLEYTVWSYKDGDMLIPVYGKDGVTMEKFVRRYSSVSEDGPETFDTIDVFTSTTYERLILKGSKWVQQQEPTAHGFTQIPVVYHRESDVAWGKGQDLIDKIERLLSDVRESNAYFAFGILFLSGDGVTVLPPKSTQGKTIISEDANANAKILGQADMSPSLKFEFEQYTKELHRTTGTVVIDPEILKGGDQSGAYIKNLYNDAIQYALDARPRWQPALEKIVALVKEALGLEQKNTLGYKTLVVISEPDIYVPMNMRDEVDMVNLSLQAGTISVKTASEIHPLANPDEYDRVNIDKEKQKEDEITRSTGLPETGSTTESGTEEQQ